MFDSHYTRGLTTALTVLIAGAASLGRLDLLKRVALFKTRFFGSSWANYDDAKPGSLRLAPPAHREAEWRQDHSKMEAMFLAHPPGFEEVVETLREAENRINVLRSEG